LAIEDTAVGQNSEIAMPVNMVAGPSDIPPAWIAQLAPHGVLVAGSYTFRMQWRVPAKAKHGRPPYLVANWATRQAQTASVAEFVARLVVHRVARS